MKFSQSLKKNRDFQNVYKKENVFCKQLSCYVHFRKWTSGKPNRDIGK